MFLNTKKFIKSLIAFTVITLTVFSTANAQLEDAGEILRAGVEDANLLMENYLGPFGKGFGTDLNTGWFNTAKTHSTLGFDISLNVSAAIVPSSEQSFNVTDLDFNQLELISGSPETPSISGDSDSNTELGITFTNPQNGQEEVLTSFTVPEGTGFPYVPAPMVQASVGLIKSTDISIRFIPDTKIPGVDGGTVGLIGFGVKHGINQWLPGGKVLPVDLSVQTGYTSFNSSADFDVQPVVDNETKNEYSASTWEGQGLELESSAFTVNAIVGKTLPFISVYGGVGIESSKTTVKTPGAYPVVGINPDFNPTAPASDPNSNPKQIERLDDPIDLELKGDNTFRAFAGFRVKLAVIQIFANYTQSSYSSANAGIGISFR